MNFLFKYWLWIQDTQLDVPLQLLGGILCVVLGYFAISKISKPADRASETFTVLYAFSLSETLIIIRKVIQFFIDFFTGSNLMQTQSVSDDHWFFRAFGFAMSPVEQRPVMDMGEDFLLGTLGTLISSVDFSFILQLRIRRPAERKNFHYHSGLRLYPISVQINTL